MANVMTLTTPLMRQSVGFDVTGQQELRCSSLVARTISGNDPLDDLIEGPFFCDRPAQEVEPLLLINSVSGPPFHPHDVQNEDKVQIEIAGCNQVVDDTRTFGGIGIGRELAQFCSSWRAADEI